MDIAQWLSEVGLAQYQAAFRDNDVDASVLPKLTADDLIGLGVTSIGHRRKLLDAIANLRQDGSAAPGQATAAPADVNIRTAAHEPERRQLTVMFCDIVGSTALSARLDPEDMRLVIRTYQDACSGVVARYDGYVAKFMGDGVLAYFGYPKAHEDDAERAVRAGLEIAEAVGKLETPAKEALAVRIGIATGLVVVGDSIGAGSAQEQAVVGDTPNLAARLQNLAEPGSVVVAGATRRLLGALFQLRDLGRQQIKGLAETVEAWGVDGIAPSEGRFEAATQQKLTPLVGREQEIGLLLERWKLAQDGDGQVVLLSGDPGIGKSRILSALRERLEAQGAQSLRFQCSPYYVNSALWPSIDFFERSLRFERGDIQEAKLQRLDALAVGQLGRPIGDVRFMASMLSIPCEDRYGPLAMTPQKFKDETLRVLVDLSEAAARRQPSVMLYEDIHWADPTTLEVLDLLIDRVRSMPLLIVLTHRPEFQSRWSQHSHVAALNLSRLTRAQSAAIVSRLVGPKALPPDLLEQIVARTDGVPLFVEELTKSILESGDLKDLGDRYERVGAGASIAIPTTLRDSLMARLDRLMPVKEVAQIGAAIGREFSYELLAAVAPIPQVQLDDALARLVESGLAFRRGAPPEATYTFKHALLQDAAYDSLLKSRRQELHGRIARVMQARFPAIAESTAEVVAHHFTQANDRSMAIPFWQKAGELALGRMSLIESISHLNMGLELVASLPQSTERDAAELALRMPLGTAWLALKGWAAPELWSSVHPALALAKLLRRNDTPWVIMIYLWVNLLSQGRVDESQVWVEKLLEDGKTSANPDVLVEAHACASGGHFFAGRLTKAVEQAEKVNALYDTQRHRYLADLINHDPKTAAGIYASVCMWMLGYPRRAARLAEENEAHARKRAHPFDVGFALYCHSIMFGFRREPAEVRKRAVEIERLGRDTSLPVLSAILAPIQHGLALIHEGNSDEGAVLLKAGNAAWEAAGGTLTATYLNALLGEDLSRSGEFDGGLQLVDRQIAQIDRPGWGEKVYYAEILRLKGSILLIKGDLEGAERSYHASLDWACEQEAKSWQLRTSMSLARLWQSQGKRAEAHDLLAPVYNWFTEGFDTADLKDAKALLQELA